VQGRAVVGTEDCYASEGRVDVELAHGTHLFMLARAFGKRGGKLPWFLA
jgi:hypothetical protein